MRSGIRLAQAVADHQQIFGAESEREEDRALVEQYQILADVRDYFRASPASLRQWAHLEIVQKLAEGATGEVFRAHDRHLQRDVALKLLKSRREDDQQLLHEGRLLARVRHPSVVTVHGAGFDQGRVGVWMELLDGRTLAEQIAQEGVLPSQRVAAIGQHLAEALAAVHDAGITHRDVKAQNVIVEENGRVVLMDFSIGEQREAGLSHGGGTPLYSAPELFLSGYCDDGTTLDIYSLGVLLFHLASGTYPVAGQTSAEIRASHRARRYLRLQQCAPTVSLPLASVIQRAIAPNARERFRSARELADALASLNQVAGGGQPTTRWRRPLQHGIAAGIVYALAGTTGNAVRPLAHPPQQLVVEFRDDAAQRGSLPWYFAPAFTRQLQERIDSLDRRAQASPGAGTLVLAFQQGDARVGITATLLRSNQRLWERQFVRPLHDAPLLQIDLTRAIARLYGAAGGGHDTKGPPSRVAYDAFLRGSILLERRTPDALLSARDAFSDAVRADDAFAEAHARLAISYLLLGAFGVVPQEEALLRARAAAERAIASRPELAAGHAAIAYALWQSSHFAASTEAFERALALNPNEVLAHHWFGLVLLDTEPDRGLVHLEKAFELAPHSPTISTDLGVGYARSDQLDRAVAHLTRTVATFPDHDEARSQLAVASYRGGNYVAADTALEPLLRRKPDHLAALALRGRIRALLQNTTSARAILAALYARAEVSFVDPRLMLGIHTALGEPDEALSLIERHAGAHWVEYLRTEPDLAPLRTNARFREVFDRLAN